MAKGFCIGCCGSTDEGRTSNDDRTRADEGSANNRSRVHAIKNTTTILYKRFKHPPPPFSAFGALDRRSICMVVAVETRKDGPSNAKWTVLLGYFWLVVFVLFIGSLWLQYNECRGIDVLYTLADCMTPIEEKQDLRVTWMPETMKYDVRYSLASCTIDCASVMNPSLIIYYTNSINRLSETSEWPAQAKKTTKNIIKSTKTENNRMTSALLDRKWVRVSVSAFMD